MTVLNHKKFKKQRLYKLTKLSTKSCVKTEKKYNRLKVNFALSIRKYTVHLQLYLTQLNLLLRAVNKFLIKKKQFFLNFSFPIEDAKKKNKISFFVYKKSISDQNFKGISQKIGLPHP